MKTWSQCTTKASYLLKFFTFINYFSGTRSGPWNTCRIRSSQKATRRSECIRYSIYYLSFGSHSWSFLWPTCILWSSCSATAFDPTLQTIQICWDKKCRIQTKSELFFQQSKLLSECWERDTCSIKISRAFPRLADKNWIGNCSKFCVFSLQLWPNQCSGTPPLTFGANGSIRSGTNGSVPAWRLEMRSKMFRTTVYVIAAYLLCWM
jgi:hypothetical protein